MLIENRRGNYSFIKGIGPYSAGASAAAGFEIEHARLHPPLPLKAGFERVSEHLKSLGRPKQSLCGMELRSPRPFSFQGFADFNAGYISVLKSWDVFQDGINPVARTNVAPEAGGLPEPALYGFSYTVARKQTGKRWPPSFVVAGAGELPEGSLSPNDVVRRGETSPAAIEEKARFVLGLMNGRLQELGAGWEDVTATSIYTVHNVHGLLEKFLLPAMGRAALQGLTWYYARPPIVTIEYEMDVRGCRREVVI
ncbi:MAG: hypothetical protein IT158_01105 [Bryobacterales bacterium]|nr:hypothetical protein [Bryobacterales bacterium]